MMKNLHCLPVQLRSMVEGYDQSTGNFDAKKIIKKTNRGNTRCRIIFGLILEKVIYYAYITKIYGT